MRRATARWILPSLWKAITFQGHLAILGMAQSGTLQTQLATGVNDVTFLFAVAKGSLLTPRPGLEIDLSAHHRQHDPQADFTAKSFDAITGSGNQFGHGQLQLHSQRLGFFD